MMQIPQFAVQRVEQDDGSYHGPTTYLQLVASENGDNTDWIISKADATMFLLSEATLFAGFLGISARIKRLENSHEPHFNYYVVAVPYD